MREVVQLQWDTEVCLWTVYPFFFRVSVKLDGLSGLSSRWLLTRARSVSLVASASCREATSRMAGPPAASARTPRSPVARATPPASVDALTSAALDRVFDA